GGCGEVVDWWKRLAGQTGLEEYVGFGVAMSLTLHVVDEALVFRSEDYFLDLFGRRLRLPAWLSPGLMSVTHAELPEGRFSFTLKLVHARLGLLIRQIAVFREVVS